MPAVLRGVTFPSASGGEAGGAGCACAAHAVRWAVSAPAAGSRRGAVPTVVTGRHDVA